MLPEPKDAEFDYEEVQDSFYPEDSPEDQEAQEDSFYPEEELEAPASTQEPTNSETKDFVVGGLVIKSAMAQEEALLLDNMMSYNASGPKFRWTLFLTKLRMGEFKSKRIILPLEFSKNSNNCRRYLARAGLKVNEDYSILRQMMPSGEVYIVIAFT